MPFEVKIPEREYHNEKTSELFRIPGVTFQIEHSLISVRKWEAKWEKPFLVDDPKSVEEALDYIRCMTLTQHINPYIYRFIPKSEFNRISDYINSKQTATWFSEDRNTTNKRKTPKRSQTVTAEVIMYWMKVQGVPWEGMKWHLSALLTTIRTFVELSSPPKKKNPRQAAMDFVALNEARLAQYNTKG